VGSQEPTTIQATDEAIDGAPFAAPVPGRARRRSEALAGLSRDHHHALARALELKRSEESDAMGAWERFVAFWEEEGNAHFAEEEDVLLPAYAEVADPVQPVVVRTLLEHLLIRAKIAAISAQPVPSVSELNQLGTWLELHVRLEERALFPLIEDALPEEALRELAKSLRSGETH
jgi:hemerythrin-like domain-containing protein